MIPFLLYVLAGAVGWITSTYLAPVKVTQTTQSGNILGSPAGSSGAGASGINIGGLGIDTNIIMLGALAYLLMKK